MTEEKDDWLDDLEGPAEKESDIGQSDIDALLSSSDDLSPPSSEGDDLGQADIDALLSGDELDSPAQLQNEDAASGGLDQSDIEALLSTPDAPVDEQPFSDPDQDEIDKLFSEPDTDDLTDSQSFPVEDIDFSDAFDTVGNAPLQSESPSDFADHEFKLEADIPDIPEPSGGWDDTKAFLDEETVALPDETVTAVASAAALAEAVDAVEPQPVKGRKLFANRKLLLAVGGSFAVLILLVSGYFFFKGKKDQAPREELAHEKIAVPETSSQGATPQPPPPAIPETPPQEPATSEEPAAEVPTLSDLNLVMPAGTSEIAITLEGKDLANQPLEYEFQSMPEHGQITGHAPLLVYTASADFVGEDSFTIRATNGKQFSPTAKVTISREKPLAIALAIPEPPAPEIQQEVAQQEAALQSKELVPVPTKESISAYNASYTISKSLIVPWEKIWRKGNSLPFNEDVGVEIIQRPRHGTLEALKGRQSVYRPDRSFNGKDTIKYRFTLDGQSTSTKTVTISVRHQNMSPEIYVAPYLAVYNAGDTVLLNASQTKDDNRDTLQFRWEQISGVPVVIKLLNNEGSQIAFVAPATFNTVSNPGVVLRLTATDEKGWSVSRDLQIKTQSRRKTAIWR